MNVEFTEDVPIWENKVIVSGPRSRAWMGRAVQHRRWFRRFYSNWEPGGRLPS